MTQLDLPAVSLQHYVDLLKRRRWQLLPVSLLGLLVGGLVAFFIPRYFVADTLIVHQQVPGQELRNLEDPFRGIVDTARETIPLAVGDALKALHWPEAQIADPYRRSQFEREIAERIRVQETNSGDKNRPFAQLRVAYRDRDGQRAAAFLNTLVQTWIQKRSDALREPAERQRRKATDEAQRWRSTFDELVAQKQELERQYGIEPMVEIAVQRAALKERRDAHRALLAELRLKAGQHVELEARLRRLRDQLDETPVRVAPDVEQLEALAGKSPQGQMLLASMIKHRQAMATTFREGTPQWAAAKRGYEQSLRLLRELVPQAAGDPDGLVPNPAHLELQGKLAAAELELLRLEADLSQLRGAVDAEQQRLDRLIVGHPLYEMKLAQIAEAADGRKAALAELQLADAVLGQLTREMPVQQLDSAKVPPRPTDPNVFVVALIGCVLGLAVAIGLILLLDIVRGTFKTVDDVERGLGLPVLGGISHLETEAERVRALSGRRRATLAAAAALAMVTIVVTVFYVDPTRLPPVIRDLLAMLLGA